MARALGEGAAASVRVTGGQALVACLKAEGTSALFGLPGVQLDWAFDALYDERDAIAVYHTRHEQAVSYMADGYARAAGRVGVCLTVPGPGVLNAMAGLATAYACSSPVLMIAGQIPSHEIGKGRGQLHEIRDQTQVLRSVTKWVGQVRRPEEVPAVMRDAFAQLRTGRPRPVAVEVPPDVLRASAEVVVTQPVGATTQVGDVGLVERAARLLGSAKRPIIFAGGGVILAGASEPLLALAEMLDAPVVMSSNGKGAISDRHVLAQSMVGGEELLPASDAVLIVGTRFLQPASSTWGPHNGQTLIQIDIDPEEIGRNCPVSLAITADARWALTELVSRVGRHNVRRISRSADIAEGKQRAEGRLAALEPLRSYALAIREALPDDGILVTDLTQVGYWSYFGGYPVYRPRTLITSGYQGTLGFGFPTALGARAAAPERKVVSISGDGGFMYNVQELSTMMRHGLHIVAVVFTDNAFGNVRRIQQQSFGGRLIASDLRNPDFTKLAELFGVDGRRATSPAELRAVLVDALGSSRPTLIEVPFGETPDPWPVILSGARD
jgi:acetolactate synthase-1/2/3 large subunit